MQKSTTSFLRLGLLSLLAGLALLACDTGSTDQTLGFTPLQDVLVVPGPNGPRIVMEPAEILSISHQGGVDGQAAYKGRLVAVTFDAGGGNFQTVLVVVYGDAAGPQVFDFQGERFAARDLCLTRSLDDGRTWSEPINISNTANQSSIMVDDDGNPATAPVPFFGNSEKPTIINNGSNILITWTDAFVPSGVQKTVRYPDSGNIEVPFYAVYAVRSTDAGATWSAPQRLTDGSRDATEDSDRGTGSAWTITWQEDPLGLQPGEAEGPGEGGSGAKVSPGTDIWYTVLSNANFTAGNPFPAPVRLTDNTTGVDGNGADTGTVGASRPNQFLFGGTCLVAYEESKGGGNLGKFIRYHVFPATNPGADPTAGAGTVISTPTENARRVRIIAQNTAGPNTGVRLLFLWREGAGNQGAPADIMGRRGIMNANDVNSTGLRPQDLLPAVDPADPNNNVAPINLSSAAGLTATSGANALENALAHRGIMRGDSIAVGASYTPDGNLAATTNQVSYNFFVRTSSDGGATWTTPVNLSGITDGAVNVKEPRIVGTPNSSDPNDPSNPLVFVVGWATEVKNLPNPPIDQDIFFTRTTDFGATYEAVQVLAGGPAAQFESQFRLSPNGNNLSALWMETLNGVTDVMFARGTAQ